jgi:hypothetical protein
MLDYRSRARAAFRRIALAADAKARAEQPGPDDGASPEGVLTIVAGAAARFAEPQRARLMAMLADLIQGSPAPGDSAEGQIMPRLAGDARRRHIAQDAQEAQRSFANRAHTDPHRFGNSCIRPVRSAFGRNRLQQHPRVRQPARVRLAV